MIVLLLFLLMTVNKVILSVNYSTKLGCMVCRLMCCRLQGAYGRQPVLPAVQPAEVG